jgi:hypothetical protein
MLAAAAKHLNSAQVVARSDPDGAYTLLYDAARKSLAAVLQSQGLRPTSRGGHYAIQEAIQLSSPSRHRGMHFGRSVGCVVRVTRSSTTTYHRSPRTTSPPANPAVRLLPATASQLVEVLPVFVD